VVGEDEVVCNASDGGFLQAPATGFNMHWHLACITATGGFRWNDGNIPGAHPENDYVLEYGRSYSARGWTIAASRDGTTFTNDRTGHGMVVAIENVSSF
jgi:hypothetical protein